MDTLTCSNDLKALSLAVLTIAPAALRNSGLIVVLLGSVRLRLTSSLSTNNNLSAIRSQRSSLH
jgi:hypothetical protein